MRMLDLPLQDTIISSAVAGYGRLISTRVPVDGISRKARRQAGQSQDLISLLQTSPAAYDMGQFRDIHKCAPAQVASLDYLITAAFARTCLDESPPQVKKQQFRVIRQRYRGGRESNVVAEKAKGPWLSQVGPRFDAGRAQMVFNGHPRRL